MFSPEPQFVALTLGNARLATWEWNISADELRWTSGHPEIYSQPVAEIDSCLAWCALVHVEDRERLQRAIEVALETQTGFQEQFRVAGKNGKTVWVLGYGKVIRAPDESLRMLGLNIDMTDWVEMLADSEARFSSTFEQAAVGIAHVATDGRWLAVNRRCCEIVGYTKEELLNLTFGDITYPDDLETDWSFVRELLRGDRASYSMEKRYLTKGKRIVWVNLTVSLVRKRDGHPHYFISVIEDITARKQLEAERDALIDELENRVRDRTAALERLSFTDPLTGIANRRRLDEQLHAEWDRAVRTGHPISCLVIDIDDFKGLNDSLGHLPADRALVAVAGELNRIARRTSDLTARYGGDEFVMVLPDTGIDGAMRVANLIEGAIQQLAFPNPGSQVSTMLTVSQGVATAWPADKGSSYSLMVAADRALYTAKKSGKNRISAADGLQPPAEGVGQE
jgi:diguanylate cyclase (GGDEF)-like protein/PAS domain S-box-containing protein